MEWSFINWEFRIAFWLKAVSPSTFQNPTDNRG